MDGRHPRRNLALTIAALLFAVPSLASCGFNYATDREYSPAAGSNNQDGVVDVLNAVIVSEDEGSGTFVASLVNGDPAATIHLTSLSFGSNSTIDVADFDPIEIKPRQAVNLADGLGIKVQGDFTKGEFLALTLGFDNGESASLNVPVVDTTYQWEGLDNGAGTPTEPSESPSPAS